MKRRNACSGIFLLSSLALAVAGTPFYRPVSAMNPRHPIALIYVDAATETELGPFPISRKYYAELITRLEPARPRWIVLKFFFTDPAAGDDAMIRVLKQQTNVLTQVGGVSSREHYSTGPLERFALGKNVYGFPDHPNVWTPYPELARHFAGVGGVNVAASGNEFLGFELVTSLNGQLLTGPWDRPHFYRHLRSSSVTLEL